MVICDAHFVRDKYSSGKIKWNSETSCAQQEVEYTSSEAHTHQSDKTIHSLVLMPLQFPIHSTLGGCCYLLASPLQCRGKSCRAGFINENFNTVRCSIVP